MFYLKHFCNIVNKPAGSFLVLPQVCQNVEGAWSQAGALQKRTGVQRLLGCLHRSTVKRSSAPKLAEHAILK